MQEYEALYVIPGIQEIKNILFVANKTQNEICTRKARVENHSNSQRYVLHTAIEKILLYSMYCQQQQQQPPEHKRRT